MNSKDFRSQALNELSQGIRWRRFMTTGVDSSSIHLAGWSEKAGLGFLVLSPSQGPWLHPGLFDLPWNTHAFVQVDSYQGAKKANLDSLFLGQTQLVVVVGSLPNGASGPWWRRWGFSRRLARERLVELRGTLFELQSITDWLRREIQARGQATEVVQAVLDPRTGLAYFDIESAGRHLHSIA